VAYLNGNKVAQANVPARLRFNSGAIADNDDSRAMIFEDFDISAHAKHLKKGNNILAFHGLNGGANSSDFLILPELQFNLTGKAVIAAAGYLVEPTPGEVNGTPYTGFLGNVTFSEKRGFFEKPFELALTSDEEDAEIRYTTNGDAPSGPSGKKYTGPITINRTTIVRAARVKPRFHSAAATHSYFFFEDIL
jgi:hypothetical protein